MLGETILVIDTDTETTQQIVTTLESEDYLVFTAQNGEVGLTMAKKVNPLLIFVNPAMTGESGLEVCKTIHGTEALRNIPIVVISTFEGATDPRYTALYGIVGSLKKPFSPEELVSKTKKVLSMEPLDAQPATEFEQPEAEYDSGFDIGEKTIVRGQELPEPQLAMPDLEHEVSRNQEADFSDRTAVKTVQDMDFADKTVVKTKEDIDSFSDKTQPEQIKSDAEEEKTDYIHNPDKKSDEGTSGGRERTYVLKKNIRRRGMGNRLIVPIIAAVVIISLGGAGFFLYKKNMLPWIGKKAQTPVAVKPVQPVQQATVKVPPPQQQQPAKAAPVTPQAPASKAVPAPAAKPVVKIPPKPVVPVTPVAAKPELKPTGKGLFSVQIGAFKNSANAEALSKELKAKGYDSFVRTGMKGKEAIFRVLIGKYENIKSASKMAKDISAKEDIKAVVFKD
ncbi:MAG: response regulator [Nitrospirae bacterium]|nr:MAG: response regulator [Nitrospirota bacterium]